MSKHPQTIQIYTLFLESLAIKAAKEVGRYTLENSNAGTRPHTPAPLKAECLELHETTALLLTTLGQRIFEATTQDTRAEGVSTPAEQSEAFYLRQPQHSVEAKAVYTTDEFVVLEGSTIRSNSVASFEGTGAARVRQRLIELPQKKSMMLSQMMSMNTFLNSQRIPRRIARIVSTIMRNTAMMASRMALRMDMVISCILYFFTVMLYPLFARISGGFFCCHARQKGGCNLLESWKRLQP